MAWRIGRWSDAGVLSGAASGAPTDDEPTSRPATSLTRLAADSRARSTVARTWLRELVEDLGVEWGGLERTPSGTAPRLRGLSSSSRAAAPAVSISHSGAYVAVAVATAGRVGIDVETHLGAFASPALVRRSCTPAELARLDQLAPVERLLRLRELWTAKEARVKANGTGLRTDLRALPVLADLEGLDRRHLAANQPFAATLVHEHRAAITYSLLGEGHAVVRSRGDRPRRSPR